MFGYVVPNQGELKGKEFQEYRSYYCGLCRLLKKKYGICGQLSLNYDMTFLGLLLTSLYEPEVERDAVRCAAHPLEKHPVSKNCYLEYAADMNILLTYYQCMDDWQDERKVSKALYGGLLYRAGKKVSRKYPDKAAGIKSCLCRLNDMEKIQSTSLDQVSGLSGEICSLLFRFRKDEWAEELHRIGFFLGKFIYLMDAYEDLEDDLKKGNYNPFYADYQREDFEDWCCQILKMMMAEVGRAYERLPVVENAAIHRNIIYSGVWCRYQTIREKRVLKSDSPAMEQDRKEDSGKGKK